MKHILQMRRVFKKKKVVDYEYQTVRNPNYDRREKREYEQHGEYYPEEEFITEGREVLKTVKSSQIEYRIRCAYCNGTNGWVKRRDAKYCSGNCRKLADKERQRAKQKAVDT